MHGARGRGACDEVAAVLGEDDALADAADLMARAADPLQPARNRGRRLDLHHEIEGAHVDPELERRGGDEAAEAARLERILDLGALGARQQSVMRADERLAGEVIERRGQPFGDAPAVDEDERRSMLAHQFEQAWMDGGPDRRANRSLRGRPVRQIDPLVEPRHVLDGNLDAQAQGLLASRVGDRDRPIVDDSRRRARELVVNLLGRRGHGPLDRRRAAGGPGGHTSHGGLHAAEEARHFVERPLCGRQADTLNRLRRERGEALERQREMGAALGRHQRVDLVDDEGLDGPQALAGIRGEQQVQRFGCRDENVGRLADETCPLGRGRVAGANEHVGHPVPLAETAGGVGDTGDGRAEITLDVHGEGFERRHVQDAAARPRPRARART